MAIRNFTPHAIQLLNKDNSITTIPSCGNVRVKTTQEYVHTKDGVDYFQPSYSDPEGMPEEIESDDVIVVSAMSRDAILQRHPALKGKVVAPGELIRNPDGTVAACKNFYV